MPEQAAVPPRTRGPHIVHVMGTVVSFDLRDEVPTAAVDDAVRVLHDADATFSLYRRDSDVSRLVRGELRVPDCHPDVEMVLELCADATRRTEGYFTVFPYGTLDPTGLVKGWAVQRASDVLAAAGSRRHAVNGGGDVQFWGMPEPGRPWQVGIAHPSRPGELVAVAACRGGAIATSGSAERGDHIVDPLSGRPAGYFGSVSVTAATLTEADVLATAAYARGESAIDWLAAMPGVEALFVGPGTRLTATPGFPLA